MPATKTLPTLPTFAEVMENAEKVRNARRHLHATAETLNAEMAQIADRTVVKAAQANTWIPDPEVDNVWGLIDADDTVLVVYYRHAADFETTLAFETR